MRGWMSIEIVKGDISEQETEAIVNAANDHLWMGAGVAGAIKRRGGREIEEEAMRKGPIPVGTAVSTGAGRLRAKYVIHAAVMGQDLTTSWDAIYKATLSSLALAEKLRVTSIAFPALGTGVGGFPLERAAEAMFKAIDEHVARSGSKMKIRVVLYDDCAFDAFQKVRARTEHGTPESKSPSQSSPANTS